MTSEERDAFLLSERTCRLATTGGDGAPHVTPVWFVWDGESLWIQSIVKSQRWTDLQRDGRVSVVADSGHDYLELRGVELQGMAHPVGEIPRIGNAVPELETPERLYADKYRGGEIGHDGRHAWLRITPDVTVSWDFRKLPS
jgi:hypothetical protein